MARYRKISVLIWNDAKFTELSDDGQLLFLFLLTHPHMTGIGAMRATLEGLAAEKNWSSQRLSKAFQEVSLKGMVKHDKKTNCLILPQFIKHNKPESPKVIKGWGKVFELIPESYLRDEQISNITRHIKSMSEPFRKTFESLSQSLSEDFGKSMPYQEQEQEQEQDIPPNPQKQKPKKKKVEPPSLEEVKAYFVENGYLATAGENAWRYYNDGDWKDSRGNPVRSWKQKMRGVWFKAENEDHGKQLMGVSPGPSVEDLLK